MYWLNDDNMKPETYFLIKNIEKKSEVSIVF